jgi:hypothetical protein
MRIKIAIFILVSFLFFACVEFEPVSPVPSIEYKDLTFDIVYDTVLKTYLMKGLIEFNFIDGDADLGVYDEVHSDTLLPDSVKFGLFIDLYEKVNGDYFKRYIVQPISDTPFIDTFLLHVLLPYDQKMDRVGQNKTIQGVIRAGIDFTQPADYKAYDTMRLEFFIRDRALNKSNVEHTRDFASSELDFSSYEL